MISRKGFWLKIEGTSGLKIPAQTVMYERHTPKMTVCTVFLANWWDLITKQIVGVSNEVLKIRRTGDR